MSSIDIGSIVIGNPVVSDPDVNSPDLNSPDVNGTYAATQESELAVRFVVEQANVGR